MIRIFPGRLAATMLALAGVGFGQKLSVEIVPMSAVDLALPVLRDGRQSNIESRSVQLLTTGQDGSNLRELFLFRERATGQVLFLVRILRNNFFGTYAEAGDLLQNTAVSIDKGVMRAFFFVRYSLLISESKARAPNLDSAQELALSDFRASGHPYPAQDWWPRDEHWIRLLERLPQSLAGHVTEPRPPPTHLRELTRSGRCWSMAINGPGEESTRIAVDDNYDLTSIESCAKPIRPVAHIILPSSETRLQVPALRDNRPATLEMSSLLAAATFPDGQSGHLHLLMLYDPRSRLFWWTCWNLYPTQPDSIVIEADNQSFLRLYSLFVADDRIAVFSSASVIESTERYPDFQTAKTHVVSVLEKTRGNIQAGRRPGSSPAHVLDLKGIPPRFFDVCISSFTPAPQLKRVEKIGGLWKLTLLGVNGNSAVVSLKDDYETTEVQLSGSAACGF